TTSTSDVYTLSLHDALPIYIIDNNTFSQQTFIGCYIVYWREFLLKCFKIGLLYYITKGVVFDGNRKKLLYDTRGERKIRGRATRSEEHTSELQSRFDLVCRL